MTRSPLDAETTLELVDDLEAVRADWSRLAERAGNVFATWEWADIWCRHLAAGARLAIAVARRGDGEAVAILPVCVTRERPVRLVRFVGAGPSDELGPVCDPADRLASATALREHVAKTLGNSGIFLAEQLPAEDPLRSWMEATTVSNTASPVLPTLGRSFDDYLASRSRNFREQVRGRERKLARGHQLAYRLTEEPARLEADMNTLMRLHEARWRRAHSSAFGGRRAGFHLEFARRALERGWLRLWTMELDGRPVAAWYGLRYAGVEFYYQSGRDPSFDRLSVGFVLLCHTIRCAFDDGMREYHFGRGGEPYKSRFAERDPGLVTLAITAGPRGRIALSLVRASLRMPPRMREVTWRLGAGTRKEAQ